MKRPEEGALDCPVLAGNPITDPIVAGVGGSAPSPAIVPPGAAQADLAVEPMGMARLGTWPQQFNFWGHLFI